MQSRYNANMNKLYQPRRTHWNSQQKKCYWEDQHDNGEQTANSAQTRPDRTCGIHLRRTASINNNETLQYSLLKPRYIKKYRARFLRNVGSYKSHTA
jgi:cation diffusion facilitator CzcD-associated flavoprotein CzcO